MEKTKASTARRWYIAIVTSLLGVLALSLAGCCELLNIGCAPNPPTNYRITGKVTVINECTGVAAHIPNQATVIVTLVDTITGQEVGVPKTINLGPYPPNPNAPIKEGSYDITVPWSGPRQPHAYKRIEVNSNGVDICNAINCVDNTKTCHDLATDVRYMPTNTIVKNVRVSCGCL